MAPLWLGILPFVVGCTDTELLVFEGSSGGSGSGSGGVGTGGRAGDGGSSVGGSSTGGRAQADGGGAGSSGVEVLVHLVDAFDDGDTRANQPGGWWYTVNDGAGQQDLSIVEDPEHPEVGLCLRTTGSNFDSWGAAVGVSIDGFYAEGEFDTLRFSARSAAHREVSFHMLGGSEPRFMRSFHVGTEWTEYTIRLDQETVTVDGAVVPLDIPSLYELQWFFFVPEPFDFWLDDVKLLRHE